MQAHFSRRTFSTLADMLLPSGERDEGTGEEKRKSFLSLPSPSLSLRDENNMTAGKLKFACTAKAFIGEVVIP